MNEQALFDLELKVLLEALYQRYHYDFRSYAVSSLRRRIRQASTRIPRRTSSPRPARALRCAPR